MGAGRNLRLAVNAPAEALIDPRLVNLVREHHPRNPRWPGLIMEVTEEEAVRNFDAVAEAAVQLKIYGVALAIDDFGSGYSSFARLKQFPFAEIKLDRSYVQGCAADPVNASICQSIVELARATGADCVAEGIEAPADRDALIRLGCELGQGYLFGRPMSVGKLIERTAADYSTMLADRQIR
jgi:EAL domain-containing protein (putative c-di-GMP-specific phosphodiesterase class I)